MLNRVLSSISGVLTGDVGFGVYRGTLGFDPKLALLPKARRIQGFFQTHRYAREIISELKRDITLREQSLWLKSQLPIIRAKPIVALHVRRGDYERYNETFGLLSSEYYLNALNHLRSNGYYWEEVWIFSDDSAVARNIIHPLESMFLIRYVDPPEGTNPLESLILFSHAEFGVIANSTYSWWSSFISDTMRAVVAPNKWFKGMQDPEQLIPENWLKIESKWE